MARRARVPVEPVPLEKEEQAQAIALLEAVGAKVYVLGTVRRKGDHPGTMQTPGISDLITFLLVRGGHARRRRLVVVEMKRRKGARYSPAQIEFRQMCLEAGIDYVSGSSDDVLAWMRKEGHCR